jgi:hypothetical protein
LSTLTTVAVAYLVLVVALCVLAALGAPLEPAARTGDVVGRALVWLVVAVDVASALRGHRPPDPAVHFAYAGCALVLPFLITGRREHPSPWVLAIVAAASAVVVVRLAATWA